MRHLVVDTGCLGIGLQDTDHTGSHMYSWPGRLDLLFGCKMAVLAKKIRYRLKKLPVQVHLCIFSLIIIYVLV